MKSIGIISIVLAMVCVASFGLAIVTGPVMIFKDLGDFEKVNIKQSENVSIENVLELEINTISSDIEVYPVLSENFEFNLEGYYSKVQEENIPKLSVTNLGEKIEVNIIYPDIIHIGTQILNLHVGIPEDYLEKLKINGASGDIYIKDLQTKEIEIRSLSGEIDVYNLENSGEGFIKTTSGDIEIRNFKSDTSIVKSLSGEINCEYIESYEDFNVESTSGDVAVRNLATNYGSFKTLSGGVYIDDSSKINKVKTASGNVYLERFEIDNDLNIETISGDVEIDFLEDADISLKFESVSGDLDNDFGDITQGRNWVYVKTGSGNLRIE